MPSSYSPLKIQLMETGENSGTWGDITNTNLGTALEEAIVGSADILFSGSDIQLTLTNTNNTQPARHLRLNLTGSSGGARVLEVPAIEKMYLINNGLADAVTVKNATGTGVAVPGGKSMVVYNDGTNVTEAMDHVDTLSAGTLSTTGNATIGGTVASAGVTATGSSSINNLTITGTFTPPSSTGTGAIVRADSPALTGTPTAPTQLTADNSTKIATTAYVTAKVQASTSGLADPGTNGVVVRTALGTTAARAIAQGTGITVTNGDGVSGNPTISINNAQVVTSVNGISPTNGNVTISTSAGLADPGSNGFVVRTALNTTAARTLVQGTGISITNTTGGGNPTISINNSVVVTSVNGISPTSGNVNVTATIADGSINAAKLSGGQSGSAPAYVARAWCNFDANAGSPVLRSTGNITSIGYVAAGSFLINFSTAMPSTYYAVAGTSGRDPGDGQNTYVGVDARTSYPSPTSFYIITEAGGGGSPRNRTYNSVIVFG